MSDLIYKKLLDFLDDADLQNLSQYERGLYFKCLEITLGNKELEALLPSSNWGLFVFKPPRASMHLNVELQKYFLDLIKQKEIVCVGSYKVGALTEKHIKSMYPGDTIMPYWADLKRNLLNLPAIYFLVAALTFEDISFDIKMIKGWYKKDESRGRLTSSEGLRAIFRQLVEKTEGYFEEIAVGNKNYEDSGIHAPYSLSSRFLQLLGFMAIDSNGAQWARKCLPWLLK
ncbi:MAG: hypothetical protein AB1472_04720 [Candidatus Omnitrophota bacterium]